MSTATAKKSSSRTSTKKASAKKRAKKATKKAAKKTTAKKATKKRAAKKATAMSATKKRAKQFDPAFNSRLSIALDYPAHGADNRQRIWHNLMLAAGLDPKKFDLAKLAAEDVNGRQIKHAIRIGMSLAANEKRDTTMTDFMKTIRLAQLFNQQLGDDKGLTGEFEPISSEKPPSKWWLRRRPTVDGTVAGNRVRRCPALPF